SCAGLTPEGYAVAKAYQDYGGYVVDTGGHTTSLGAIDSSVTETQVTNLFQDIQWIRDHLVIISGNIDMTNGNVINNDNTETGDPGTVVPIPSAVVPTIVAFSTDSGIISDHITNDSTLTLTGTAEANSTVKYPTGPRCMSRQRPTARGRGATPPENCLTTPAASQRPIPMQPEMSALPRRRWQSLPRRAICRW